MIITLFLGIAYNRLHPKESIYIHLYLYIDLLSIDLFFVNCPCYAEKDLGPSK